MTPPAPRRETTGPPVPGPASVRPAAVTSRRPQGTLLRFARTAVAAFIFAVALGGALIAGIPAAEAATCPPASAGGTAVASIRLADGTRVPVKPVSYPRGGVLAPPPSNKVAGLSRRHQPLDASEGTTVIVWHVRYGVGCKGSLNPILDHPIGQILTITPTTGDPVDYVIVRARKVAKGKYRSGWFRQDGPHRLLLATCSDLTDGVFRTTTVLFAEPVQPASSNEIVYPA